MVTAGDPGTGFGNAFAVILRTTDGGQSWQIQHESQRNPTTCWKITFPTDSIGYVSIEIYDLDSVFVLKTTDQGVSWQEKFIDDNEPWFQGIGFVNKNTGWIGPSGAYSTTDGGETWQPATFVANFNRFRKVNDTLADKEFSHGNHVVEFQIAPLKNSLFLCVMEADDVQIISKPPASFP